MWKLRSMEVEIEGEDGSKLATGPQETVFGRGCGFNSKDRTVSRRHVCFQLNKSESEEEGGGSSRVVSFEVIGRNPIWVCSHKDQSLKLFRKFEKGHLEFGDRFSLSAKTPVWFHLNNNNPPPSNEAPVAEPHSEKESEIEASSPRVDLDIDKIDLSQIDPVKEFGFLVMGHEFDHYPKGKIRDVKDWEWFLDEPSKDSDDEENEGRERRKMKRKRKRGKDNEDDEEWGGESEDDKDLVAKITKGKRPGYSTRSKDSEKGPNRGTKCGGTSSKQKKTTEDDDEDDETLGGFIVDDEEDDKEEDDEEEGEEEFEDDKDDDED